MEKNQYASWAINTFYSAVNGYSPFYREILRFCRAFYNSSTSSSVIFSQFCRLSDFRFVNLFIGSRLDTCALLVSSISMFTNTLIGSSSDTRCRQGQVLEDQFSFNSLYAKVAIYVISLSSHSLRYVGLMYSFAFSLFVIRRFAGSHISVSPGKRSDIWPSVIHSAQSPVILKSELDGLPLFKDSIHSRKWPGERGSTCGGFT
jgi:hypothetical protein